MDTSIALDLLLLQSGRSYDLDDQSERARSNRDLVDLFLMIQDRTKPELSLEIGAFDAKFSVAVRRRLGKIQSIAFEGNPYNFKAFSEREDIITLGIDYINSAVSDHSGMIDFLVQKSVDGAAVEPIRGNNSLLARAESGIEYEPVKVPCTSIRDFLAGHGLTASSFCAWIDVEGAAGQVLCGMVGTLDRCVSILIEVEQHPIWEGQWLWWNIVDFLISNDFVPIARDFEFAHQFNVIFVSRKLMRQSGIRDALAIYYSKASNFGRRSK